MKDAARPARVALVMAQTTGGIGRHVSALASEIKERGGEVSVFGSAASAGFAGTARFEAVDIPLGISPVRDLRAVLTLSTRLRGFDLVHAHGTRAGALAAASKPSGTRLVVTIHNALVAPSSLESLAASAAAVLTARRADARIYVSDDLAAAAPSRGRVEVIPVGADVTPLGEAAVEAARAFLRPEEGPVAVSVGRLAKQKRFDLLIEAASQVRSAPRPRFFIAGEGPERPRLEALIEKLGLENKVFLLGERPDARALLSAADLVCVPSDWEGSSLALHEAMAAARPIVARAVGGIPAQTGLGEAALLVSEDSAGALAVAIDLLVGDETLRAKLGAAAAEAAAAWPDAAATARRVAGIYEELLGRPLSPAPGAIPPRSKGRV